MKTSLNLSACSPNLSPTENTSCFLKRRIKPRRLWTVERLKSCIKYKQKMDCIYEMHCQALKALRTSHSHTLIYKMLCIPAIECISFSRNRLNGERVEGVKHGGLVSFTTCGPGLTFRTVSYDFTPWTTSRKHFSLGSSAFDLLSSLLS